MTQVLSVVDRKVAYMEKSRKFDKKTEEFIEMNKLTLNTNKTDLSFSRAIIQISDLFFYKNEVLTTQKVADILVFKLTGILVSRSS